MSKSIVQINNQVRQSTIVSEATVDLEAHKYETKANYWVKLRSQNVGGDFLIFCLRSGIETQIPRFQYIYSSSEVDKRPCRASVRHQIL